MQSIFKKTIILLIIVTNIVTIGIFFVNRSEFILYINDYTNEFHDPKVSFKGNDVLEFSGAEWDGRYYQIKLTALNKGNTDAEITVEADERTLTIITNFSVNSLGTITRTGPFDFPQWHIIWLGAHISMALLSIYLLQKFRYLIKNDIFSYKTQFAGGIAIFFLALTLLNLAISILLIPNYKSYNAGMFITYISTAFLFFTMATIPFVIGFGLALSVSNLMLIKKEGFRTRNVLGIAISVALLAAIFIFFVLPLILDQYVFVKPGMISDALRMSQYVFLGLFCFFLSFLLSTMICGLIAAKRVPQFNKDYIIILGCGIREDGTLKPLLQGRVDRAIWFWNKQYEKSGKRAIFVPSGGKGSDEIISEGEAIKRYLLSKGIPEDCIKAETKSATTLENMKFSKDIIDAANTDANVMFSTTNYHVFRSGMLAKEAGLNAEGIGAKTRWYFWPNAFVREFIGMLYNSRKYVLTFFAVAALMLSVLSITIKYL